MFLAEITSNTLYILTLLFFFTIDGGHICHGLNHKEMWKYAWLELEHQFSHHFITKLGTDSDQDITGCSLPFRRYFLKHMVTCTLHIHVCTTMMIYGKSISSYRMTSNAQMKMNDRKSFKYIIVCIVVTLLHIKPTVYIYVYRQSDLKLQSNLLKVRYLSLGHFSHTLLDHIHGQFIFYFI